jgi:hypothetical protein
MTATLLYSDAQSWTVIAVSPSARKLTIQRDHAVRSNLHEDEFSPGGFVGHRSHPGGQEWLIEPDPKGQVKTAFWSDKRGRYVVDRVNGVTEGRHEFYDYNF